MTNAAWSSCLTLLHVLGQVITPSLVEPFGSKPLWRGFLIHVLKSEGLTMSC